MNGHIGDTAAFMSFYLNVFFFERLEISRSRQARKTSFERVFVKRLTFAQADALAKISVWESLISAEFDSPHNVERHRVEIKPHGRQLCHGVKHRNSSQPVISISFVTLRVSVESHFPIAAQRFHSMRGERTPRSHTRQYRTAFLCRT